MTDADKKCQHCGKAVDGTKHSCPYQSDVNSDSEYQCNCCDDCAYECAMDI